MIATKYFIVSVAHIARKRVSVLHLRRFTSSNISSMLVTCDSHNVIFIKRCHETIYRFRHNLISEAVSSCSRCVYGLNVYDRRGMFLYSDIDICVIVIGDGDFMFSRCDHECVKRLGGIIVDLRRGQSYEQV